MLVRRHAAVDATQDLLKQTTNTVFARIGAIKEVLDVHTLSQATDRKELTMNDIGRVALTLQKPLVCDVYDSHQGTGAFVLIDEATHHTVAAGMIRRFRLDSAERAHRMLMRAD